MFSHHPWLSNLRGDLAGGIVSAAIAIPLAMGFGMFAFVALGDEYLADGAKAGLLTAFVVAAACLILGDRTTHVYAPRVTTTFFIGFLLYQLVHSEALALRSGSHSLTLLVFFFIIVLAGAFQALFGVIRLGTVMRFTPHPVMAGFQNTAAILLFLVQIGNVLGFEKVVSFTSVGKHLGEIKPLSVVLAAAVFIAMWNARRFAPKIPPLIFALGIGTILYYALQAAGLSAYLGPVIGTVPDALITPTPIANMSDLAYEGRILDIWLLVIGGALALAIIASLDALLCQRLVMEQGAPRGDGDALLVRFGLANVAAAGFGGITSGFNIGASIANRTFGGRTPLSVIVNAGAILLAFTVLFPVVAMLPRAVLSAVIMVIAVQHLDPWSMDLFRRLTSSRTRNRWLLVVDAFVVVFVAILSLTINIVAAVFVGLAIAVLLFVLRMSRSNIRRTFRCDRISSRTSRPAAAVELLEKKGGLILVAELQGALFFGSAETLVDDIENAVKQQPTQTVILDLRRVTEIDSTGARILSEIASRFRGQGRSTAFAIALDSELGRRLEDLGTIGDDDSALVFSDVDRAMEWAENLVLAADRPNAESGLRIGDFGVLHGFSDGEVEAVRPYLEKRTYRDRDLVFAEGDPGTDLFMILSGTATISVRPTSGAGNIRLATLSPGTVFGELAVLDGGPRSASVTAEGELSVLVLSVTQFEALSAAHPALAIKFLANVGRELSRRLRRANKTIHQLEA